MSSPDMNHVELTIPEEWLAESWNKQADDFNQWDSLSLEEQLQWAQVKAVEADRARAALAEPVGEGPTDDGDTAIDRWIESRPGWPNDWPAVTQCQLTALIGEALEHWGRPTPPAPDPGQMDNGWFAVAIVAQDMRSRGLAQQMAGDELLKLANQSRVTTPAPLPANYIDPEHTGRDRELLETFYRSCNAEGGTADEIHLRGIRAVLATCAALQAEADDCPGCEGTPARLRHCPTHGQQPPNAWGCPECVREMRLALATQPAPEVVPVGEQP